MNNYSTTYNSLTRSSTAFVPAALRFFLQLHFQNSSIVLEIPGNNQHYSVCLFLFFYRTAFKSKLLHPKDRQAYSETLLKRHSNILSKHSFASTHIILWKKYISSLSYPLTCCFGAVAWRIYVNNCYDWIPFLHMHVIKRNLSNHRDIGPYFSRWTSCK